MLFKRKWFMFMILIVVLLLASGKISVIRQYSSDVIDKMEIKWRDWKTPELAGLEGKAVLVMDRDSGKILYEDHMNRKMYPASTTKILTALILLESGDVGDIVTVGSEVERRTADESSAGLYEGEKLSVKDLIAAMLLPSGNDAARTAAIYVAERKTGQQMEPAEAIRYFAGLMNERAKQLGANHSHFVNPHGLHDPDHYSTAKDLAAIAREAMNHPEIRAVLKETVHQVHQPGQRKATFDNRNKLLQKRGPWYYQGATGMKTGYTDEASYCFVGAASRNDKNLISVVLHSTEDGVWNDTIKLLNYGFGS